MKLLLLILLFVAMTLPMLVAMAVVVVDRRKDKRLQRRLPISSKVLNSAGDSLRTNLERMSEEIDSHLVSLALIAPLTVACWALIRVKWLEVRFGIPEIVLAIAVVVGSAWSIRRLTVATRDRRKFKEGLIAERFTAQELNRLTAAGCAVFHDVPADGFNVDHIVVGVGRVFAIETKSRRKPEGVDGHKVRYDGARLSFPGHTEVKPLEQAERSARWLSKHLEDALGRPVPVVPVVALPGWYIDPTKEAASARVKVMPVGGKSSNFMVDPAGHHADPAFRNLVSRAISMLYPERDTQSLI